MAGSVAACLAAATPLRAQILTEEDFRQIGPQGFGERANSYAWSTAYFHNKLFVGSNRNFACVVRSIGGAGTTGRNPEVPIECGPSLADTDLRARIFTYDPRTQAIETAYVSPTARVLTSDGTFTDQAVDAGYRTMTVFTEPDGMQALYVGTFSAGEGPGSAPRILRSTDGIHFKPVPGPAVNNDRYRAFRAFTPYKGRLYVLAIGRGRDGTSSVLLEAHDPASGDFRVVSAPGFGDPTNLGGFELAVFKGFLYVGTGTATDGFQLLKTQAVGEPPYVFQKVIVNGAYRGSKNQNVVSMMPYKDHLYVGTGINFAGLELFPDVNVAPAELIRVRADDSWELVAGESRHTPVGFKEPISGMRPGLGNALTGYFWRMVEHDGVLYVGTFDNAVVAQYSDDLDIARLEERAGVELPPELIDLILRADPDEIGDVISAVEGGFDLWATIDGIDWTLVSRTGFGDQFSYGVRSFVSLPFGLFLGTANPFFGFRLYLGQRPGTDTDGDSHVDGEDNCPLTWNLSQADRDADGVGDVCDADNDNDCLPDAQDDLPLTPQVDSVDTDADGVPDVCDRDDDGDGLPDVPDNCPLTPNADQADGNGNGIGDACDTSVAMPATGDEPAAPDGPPRGSRSGSGQADEDDRLQAVPIPQPCGAGTGLVLFGGLLGILGMNLHARRSRVAT